MLPAWLKVKGLKEPLAHIGREPSSCFPDTLEKKETAAFHFLCKTAPVSARAAVTALPCCMKLSPSLRGFGGTTQQDQAQWWENGLNFRFYFKKPTIYSACLEPLAFLAIVRMKAIGHIIIPTLQH